MLNRLVKRCCDVKKTVNFTTLAPPKTQWCKRWGCTRTPQVLIGQISKQNPWKFWQKWHPTFAEKYINTLFFWGHTNKRCSWAIFVGENL